MGLLLFPKNFVRNRKAWNLILSIFRDTRKFSSSFLVSERFDVCCIVINFATIFGANMEKFSNNNCYVGGSKKLLPIDDRKNPVEWNSYLCIYDAYLRYNLNLMEIFLFKFLHALNIFQLLIIIINIWLFNVFDF